MSNQPALPIEKCSACDASIVWMKTEKKLKWQPFDAKPESRSIMAQKQVKDPHGEPRTITVARVVPTYMPHHATCPHAEKFKRGKS